jgi:hypothetical protein
MIHQEVHMKTLTSISVLAFFLLSFVLVSTSSAQEKETGKNANTTVEKQSKQKTGPRFVDEDGDGVCDQQRSGRGKGRGQHRNQESSEQKRDRLRDGSCGSTGSNTSGAQRRGQQNDK